MRSPLARGLVALGRSRRGGGPLRGAGRRRRRQRQGDDHHPDAGRHGAPEPRARSSPSPLSQPWSGSWSWAASPGAASRSSRTRSGDRIQFSVTSDVADEIHVHGYDLKKDVPAGGSVRFSFPATHRGRLRGRARGPQAADRRAEGQPRMRKRWGRCRRGGGGRGAGGPGAGVRPRARGARGPSDPGVAVRLGCGRRPDRVLRRARPSVAGAQARGQGLLPPPAGGSLLRSRQRRDGGVRGPGRRRAAGADHLRRTGRGAVAAGELRPHLHLRDLLGRPGSGQHPVRGRLSRIQPVARDRARRGLGDVPLRRARCPRRSATRTGSAGGPRPLGLFGFAWIELVLHERRRPERAGDRGAGLHRDHPARDRVLRHGGVDLARRELLGLLQPVLADLGGRGAGRPARPAPAALRAHAPRSRGRERSRCSS